MAALSLDTTVAPAIKPRLKLTLQMKRAFHFLEWPLPRLGSYLRSAAAENPFLEMRGEAGSERGEEAQRKKDYFEQTVFRAEASLAEELWKQFSLFSLTPHERRVGREIIGNLNADGYLAASLEEAAEGAGVSVAAAESALVRIQMLDPPGIGARDLRECLRIQLARRKEEDVIASLAMKIIEEHLSELAERNDKNLALKLGATVANIQEAARLIRSLDPKPGRDFSTAKALAVVPDVIVRRAGKKYLARVNDEKFPPLRINPRYCRFLDDPRLSLPERKEWRKRWREGIGILTALRQRRVTLERLANFLAARQTEFLKKGDAYLKPLGMSETASALGIHRTTVWRAAKGKYAETPRGVIKLKAFFGGRRNVQALIQNLTRREDKKRPLTDGELAAVLRARGISLARRTVAKYRWELGIPSAHFRKNREK